MIDVWLVRHGEAAASWDQSPDPGLSELGQQQARAAAAQLQGVVPNEAQLLTSPKARARETGEPFARDRGMALREAAAFIEIQAPVPLSERKQWLRGFMADQWDAQPASLWAWRDGIIEQLRALQAPTVVFTHFLVINAVLAAVSGEAKVLQAWPANGSIHHFRVSSDALELVSLGEQMESIVN